MHVNNVWHTQKHSPCPSDHARDTELEMGAQSLFSTGGYWCAVYVSNNYVSVTRVSTCTSSIPQRTYVPCNDHQRNRGRDMFWVHSGYQKANHEVYSLGVMQSITYAHDTLL